MGNSLAKFCFQSVEQSLNEMELLGYAKNGRFALWSEGNGRFFIFYDYIRSRKLENHATIWHVLLLV